MIMHHQQWLPVCKQIHKCFAFECGGTWLLAAPR